MPQNRLPVSDYNIGVPTGNWKLNFDCWIARTGESRLISKKLAELS